MERAKQVLEHELDYVVMFLDGSYPAVGVLGTQFFLLVWGKRSRGKPMTVFVRFCNSASYSWGGGHGMSGWTFTTWSHGHARSASESWTQTFSLTWSQSWASSRSSSR